MSKEITQEQQEQRMQREATGLQDADALYGVSSIEKKVFEIRNTIGKLKKDKENPFYHSQYFDINSLLDELQSYLEANKILLTQPVMNGEVYSILKDLDTGEIMSSSIPLPSIEDPQKIGSAITYFRRYSLKSLLALSEEDDDGNKASKSAPDDNKKWLNATDKSGKLNKTGESTAKKLASGDVTWKDIYKKVKVSTKDRDAIEERVKQFESQ